MTQQEKNIIKIIITIWDLNKILDRCMSNKYWTYVWLFKNHHFF